MLCEVTYFKWPSILCSYNIPLLSCFTTESSVHSLIQHYHLLLFYYFITFPFNMNIYKRYKHVKMRDINRVCAI